MKYYHITPTKNLASIFEHGLWTGDGIDGPGLYVWNGDLREAIKNADISFSDSWYELPYSEIANKMREMSVLEVEIDDTPIIDWGDYSVFENGVESDKIKYIGVFLNIAEELSKT